MKFKFGKKNNTPETEEDFDEIAGLADDTPHSEYDDYEVDDVDIEKPVNTKRDMSPVKKILIFGIPIILGIAAGWYVLNMDSKDTGDNPPAEQTQVQTTKEAPPANNGEGIVINESVGKTHVGKENGDPSNGIGAILAFDYAYYVDRDGDKARSFFNPEATSYDAAFIQNHIDEVPEGTDYELEITPVSIGQEYDVILSLKLPGAGKVVSYQQKFETMEKDGVFYVKTFDSTPILDKK